MGSKNKFYADIMAFNSEVTGSCILCNVKFPNCTNVRFLVDCGLYQEKRNDQYNHKLEFMPDSIDFVLVTHSHIDHIGKLPFLVKKGYRSKIYASKEVAGLFMEPALKDSQSVIEADSKMRSMPPLYSERDVETTLSLTEGMEYFEEWSPAAGIKVAFYQNAHVPGAVVILVRAKYEGCGSINILFSGDYNAVNAFFCSRKVPDRVKKLPNLTVVVEATYGTTNSADCQPRFEAKMAEVIGEGRNILLMAYSFGRTQEVLYRLQGLQRKRLLSPEVPIYLDGKLGMKYTMLFQKLDISDRMKDFLPENFHLVSKASREQIVASPEQKIIVTSSGNGSYGPALFYEPYFLQSRNAFMGFTGYVHESSVGDKLKRAAYGSSVKVGGEVVFKRSEVDFFNEFSAHAKADVLLDFLREFENLKFVLINHGEPETKLAFADRVKREINPKNVGILDRDYWFRVDEYGFVKSFTTKF
ncbi:MAG: MBL fold metallo-hydrolase [Clostridia bacterium]|nr:MBL fold metallo-hydrolase [Clostridia bacterium]